MSAFDTIDHNLLLELLESRMGIKGSALLWFKSYLSRRSLRVCVRGSFSDDQPLLCGVPQGSVLGPVLFTTYIQPLQDILHDIDFHIYADDSQIYLSFNPRSPTSAGAAIDQIQQCFYKIKAWMTSHFLHLNDTKTEVLVITSPKLSKHIQFSDIKLGKSEVAMSKYVRNLGVTWDSNMKLNQQVKNVCKKAYYHLHNIYRIRKYLTVTATKSLIHAFITSRLDYCNGLLYGIPDYLVDCLQRVQNTAARLVTSTPRSDHITPVLHNLHWLPVSHRIRFKILLLVFKALHGMAPLYITDLLNPYTPSRSLRSSNQHLLVVPSFNLKTYGGRAFNHIAPLLWNNLPPDLRCETKLTSFKTGLKTHLFKDAFSII